MLGRSMGYADARGNLAKRKSVEADLLEQLKRNLNQRLAKVPMMVCRFACHGLQYRVPQPSVKTDLDTVKLEDDAARVSGHEDAMNFPLVFSLCSSAAMAGWLALCLLPRWPWLLVVLRSGLIAALSLTYAVLIFVFFFRAEGGFDTIEGVRALFQSDGALVAGWVHYLAFDLFIGIWIANEADRHGWNRILQLPILAATFLFGPIGLLLYQICRATQSTLTPAKV